MQMFTFFVVAKVTKRVAVRADDGATYQSQVILICVVRTCSPVRTRAQYS